MNTEDGNNGSRLKGEMELVDLATWLYNEMATWLRATGGMEVEVEDVWALVDVDNARLETVANGCTTPQRFEPGTYFLIRVDGLEADPMLSGLTAFPLLPADGQ